MALWGAIGLGVSVIGSLYAGKKQSDSAKDQARLNNEATERQYAYDTELYHMNQQKLLKNRETAVQTILANARNEQKIATFKDATNLRDYQYSLMIRNREQDSLDTQYERSEDVFHAQTTLNDLSAISARENEYRKLQEIEAEAMFDMEEAHINQLLNEGKFRARGTSGRTAGKVGQVTLADYGRAMSQVNEALSSAGRNTRAVLEEISQDRFSADLAAHAQRMLDPGILPMPLVPLATPVAEQVMPREVEPFDFGPAPVKGAYVSPSAAAGQVWGATLSSVAGAVGTSFSKGKDWMKGG